jgi:hypothetical protein
MEWLNHLRWWHVGVGGTFYFLWRVIVRRFFDRWDERRLERRNREWLNRLYREQLEQQHELKRKRDELGRID